MTPNLRELTPAERAYLDRAQRGRRVRVTVLVAVITVFWVMPLRATLGQTPLGSDDFWAALAPTAALAVASGGIYYLFAIRRPVWRLRDGGYARVGRVSGRYRVRGKANTQYVGDCKVSGEERLGLVEGQDVTVEVCPAVEDYRGWSPRVVLRVGGGPPVASERTR